MKYLKQLAIIMVVSFIGELLHGLISLPVPASIYGIVLMFILLECKLVKLHDVEDTAQFFMAIMPILFVDSNVKLMTVIPGIKGQLVGILVIAAFSTVIVTAVTGQMAQLMIRMNHKQSQKQSDKNGGEEKHE